MPSLRRLERKRREKTIKPEIVTGNFELHYEEIVSRNRIALVAVFATGLVLLAAFVPSAVYQSVADTDQVSVEVESGVVTRPELVTKVEGDMTASGNGYIEFRLPVVNDATTP